MLRFVTTILIGILCLGLFQGFRMFSIENVNFWEAGRQGCPTANRVICGDSHGKTIWLPQSVNMCYGGDPMCVQLAAVSKYLAGDKEFTIKEVVISVGPQNFSRTPIRRYTENEDKWIDGNLYRLVELGPYLLSNPASVGDKLGLGFLGYKRFKFWAEPRAEEGSDLSASRTRKRLTMHRTTEKGWFQRHAITTGSLEAFLQSDYAKQREVILVGTPLHPDYFEQIEREGFNEYAEFIDSLVTNYSNLSHFDVEQADIPASFFRDCDHLNKLGACWLSDTLMGELNNRFTKDEI